MGGKWGRKPMDAFGYSCYLGAAFAYENRGDKGTSVMIRVFFLLLAMTISTSLEAAPIWLGGPSSYRSSEHSHRCSEVIQLRNGLANLQKGKFEESFPIGGMATDIRTSAWTWKWSLLEDFPGAFIAKAKYSFEANEYVVGTNGLTLPPGSLNMMRSLKPKKSEKLQPTQVALLEANEIYQIAQINMAPREPTFEEYLTDTLTRFDLDKADQEYQQQVLSRLMANEEIKDNYKSFLAGNEISSVERLQTLKITAEELAMFADGILSFSNDDYSILLSRSASAAMVCLPEEKLVEGKLDGRAVKKALFDFSVKANGMKFLSCEDVLRSKPR